MLLLNIYPVCNWGGWVVMLIFKLHRSHREAHHLLKLLCKNFSRVSQTHAQRSSHNRQHVISVMVPHHVVGSLESMKCFWDVKWEVKKIQRGGDSRGNLLSCITWPHRPHTRFRIVKGHEVTRWHHCTVVDCDLHFWPDIKMIKMIYWLLPHLSRGMHHTLTQLP